MRKSVEWQADSAQYILAESMELTSFINIYSSICKTSKYLELELGGTS